MRRFGFKDISLDDIFTRPTMVCQQSKRPLCFTRSLVHVYLNWLACRIVGQWPTHVTCQDWRTAKDKHMLLFLWSLQFMLFIDLFVCFFVSPPRIMTITFFPGTTGGIYRLNCSQSGLNGINWNQWALTEHLIGTRNRQSRASDKWSQCSFGYGKLKPQHFPINYCSVHFPSSHFFFQFWINM